jgi:carbonic anhydrase
MVLRFVSAALAAAILRGRQPALEFFNYGKHGQDWVGGSCASRARQSPIDLPAKVLAELPLPQNSLHLRYQHEREFTLVNNGHCITADVENEGLGGLTFDNAWYNLLAVNLHAKGEHTFAGHRPALELHLVHKKYDSDALVVLAVPFEAVPGPAPTPKPAGNATNGTNGTNSTEPPPDYVRPDPKSPGYTPTLEVFHERAPPTINTQVRVLRTWDINALVDGTYVSYDGSLTAPPCSENVRWFVRQSPLEASEEQVNVLSGATYQMNPQGNWRLTFPLADRPLTVAKTVKDEPRLNVTKKAQGPRDGTTLSEREALSWGVDAVEQAMMHLGHLKNLDQRLRGAADASAQGLQPTPPAATVPFVPGAHGGDPLYYPSAVAQGIATSLRKAMDESVKNMASRMYPKEPTETMQAIKTTLNNGMAAGNAKLAEEGLAPSAAIPAL